MTRSRPLSVVLLCLLLGPPLSGCLFYKTDPALEAAPDSGTVDVKAPIRAHLSDGNVVIFRDGAMVGPDTIMGPGTRYDLTRRDQVAVSGVSMESVIGLESSARSRLDVVPSVLATAGAAAVGMAAGSALFVAIFGSCPTVYTAEPSGEVMEAELFSYSIAPLLEARDVDVLGASAEAGVIRLHVRNEALETHLINQLELLEVRHGPAEQALPDPDGLPLVVAGLVAPVAATDRDGRDLLSAVRAADATPSSASEARIDAAASGDFEDVIELAFPRESVDGASAAGHGAVVLHLRNSLLNTILFYDLLLGSAGADALTWLASDLQRIGPAVQLGRWWVSRMGMRVDVFRDGEWVEAARVPDTGPIAWTRVAVPVDVPTGAGPVRIRLRSVADQWRVDRVALALDARRPDPIAHAPARILDFQDTAMPRARAAVDRPDERYLENRPGDRFVAEFDVGPTPDAARTFLLASQGYYTEWIRPEWVRRAAASGGPRLEPGDAMLQEALRRWATRRGALEEEFFASRIPTR